jgi:hypothetical protein
MCSPATTRRHTTSWRDVRRCEGDDRQVKLTPYHRSWLSSSDELMTHRKVIQPISTDCRGWQSAASINFNHVQFRSSSFEIARGTSLLLLIRSNLTRCSLVIFISLMPHVEKQAFEALVTLYSEYAWMLQKFGMCGSFDDMYSESNISPL